MKRFTLLSILAIVSILTFSSCKKEENKAPITSTPTTASIPADKYVISSYNSNSFNVDDTLELITTSSGALRLTIPVKYGIDTMNLVYDTALTGTMHQYTFDHIVKYNTAYHLVGSLTRTNNMYLVLSFSQRINPYGPSNAVQQYYLHYAKL